MTVNEAYGQCDEAGLIETTTPAPPYSSFALRHHLLLVKETAKITHIRAVALGDSIVQLWPDQSLKHALSETALLNLGVGSDRVQNTLWRLRSGHFDHIHTDQVMVLLGTNNLGSDSSCSIVAGYKVLIAEIRRVFKPDRIVIVEILHRETKPDRLEHARLAANDLLRTLQSKSIGVTVISLDTGSPDFYEADGLHPSATGYASLSEQLQVQLPKLRNSE